MFDIVGTITPSRYPLTAKGSPFDRSNSLVLDRLKFSGIRQ